MRQQQEALTAPKRPNKVWSMDFMNDHFSDGLTCRLAIAWMKAGAHRPHEILRDSALM